MQDSLGKIREFLQVAKFKILLGALGLSILIIVGLGGYIVGQNKLTFGGFQAFKATEQPSPTPQPQSSQTPTPTPTSTPTAQGTTKVTPTTSPQSTTSSPAPTQAPVSTQAPTPTPTAQKILLPKFSLGSAGISFSTDKTTLARGQCAKLNWNVSNASSVTLTAGSGSPENVALNNLKEVCPPFSKGFTNQNGEDTTYTLKVKKSDGSTEEKKVVITVKPIRVVTTFSSLKVLNSAALIFEGESKSTIGFKFSNPYNGGEWPKGGFGTYASGEQVDISNATELVSPIAITDDYNLGVSGTKDPGTSKSKYLGGMVHYLTAPPSPSWNGTYTKTSISGIGQFELSFAINVTMP